jgi:hypothetical protein
VEKGGRSGSLNSGLHTCLAGVLQREPLCQLLFCLLFKTRSSYGAEAGLELLSTGITEALQHTPLFCIYFCCFFFHPFVPPTALPLVVLIGMNFNCQGKIIPAPPQGLRVTCRKCAFLLPALCCITKEEADPLTSESKQEEGECPPGMWPQGSLETCVEPSF